MRLGLMSDLHGNAHAVRAVLTDAEFMGVDEWWVLGGLVALGPDPVDVLELLAALPNVRCIGGNTQRYILTGDRPYPDFGAVRQNATYAIIDATENRHQVVPRVVDYDHDAFVRKLYEVGHPSADYLQQFQIVLDST